jgi:hypothetical protein
MTKKEVSREEIMGLFCARPNDLHTLEWKPLIGLFKNTLRLRMNITPENASLPLVDACRKFIYPLEDPLEIQGLVKALDMACSRANLNYQIMKGPRELQKGAVGFFEPYKIQLPFKKVKLSLTIAPGEFQWILQKVKKEKPPLANKLEILKQELLKETKEWLRRGNR